MTKPTPIHAFGPKYAGDDEFKARARRHQSRYRLEELGLPGYRAYGNRLDADAALAGRNFYGFRGVRDAAAERFGHGDKKLYSDMLASDHIPFNVFVPLRADPLAGRLIEKWLGVEVTEVTKILVEWAPAPSSQYLDDRTSFDVYLEYVGANEERGGVGVEVKYTEREYSWGETEKARMFNPASRYNLVHDRAGIYVADALAALRTRRLKQFWRNQLLGASMLLRPNSRLSRFTSILLYPEGNHHFADAAREYGALLVPECREQFIQVTYEQFIADGRTLGDSDWCGSWLKYLENRYVV